MEEQYLFPFFNDEIEEFIEGDEVVENEIYKDIKWDYEYNQPIIYNGDFVIVEGLEAIKGWAFRALQTQRAKYLAFSWDYGVDVESFVGKVLTTKEKIDITREIKDCLLQNKHIINVVNFKFMADRREITITFKILSEYGEIDRVTVTEGNNNVTDTEKEFISMTGVRVHIGENEPFDTSFWYDPSDD